MFVETCTVVESYDKKCGDENMNLKIGWGCPGKIIKRKFALYLVQRKEATRIRNPEERNIWRRELLDTRLTF
jgi:hypothetical protein